MKTLLVIALVLVACRKDDAPPRNLAVESARELDADLKCVPYFTGEGAAVVHSARCKLSDKTLAYCRITVDSKMLECGPLFPAPPAPPKPEKSPEAPAPIPPATGSGSGR